MPRVSRDGVTLHYEHETGPRETVVFLQPAGYGRWLWRWQREALRGAYAVVAPDTRGTGRSEAGLPPVVSRLPGRLRTPLLGGPLSYSVAGLAADLEAVLADAGARNVHLVGANLGGMVALQYALDHARAASLTLVATSPGGPDAVPVPEDVREAVGFGPRGTGDRRRARESLRPVFTDAFTNRNPHLLDRLVEWRLDGDAGPPAAAAQAGALFGFDASAELGRLRLPTLILHGTADRVVPVENAELLGEVVPNSRVELCAGGSHGLVVENADWVADELRAFLDAHRETASDRRLR